MFFIINKNMIIEIRNKDIYQYFGDAIYRCTPSTLRGYKLYVISGYNFVIKRTIIVAFILTPNETFTTYNSLFHKLKNDFCFKPKIFNVDFNQASTKAVKKNFLEVYLVKCFFHFIKCFENILKNLTNN